MIDEYYCLGLIYIDLVIRLIIVQKVTEFTFCGLYDLYNNTANVSSVSGCIKL